MRDRKNIAARRVALLLPLVIALGASQAPAAAAPQKARDGAGPTRSAPPDPSHAHRPPVSGEATPQAATTPAPGVTVVDPLVDNTDPNLATTDMIGGSEPSVARNPADPDEVVITGFSGNWGPNAPNATNAPLFHSTDGGATWTKRFTIPAPPGRIHSQNCPCDQTIDFDRAGNLFGTFLINFATGTPAGPGEIASGSTPDPASAGAWQWRGNPAQLTNNAHPTQGDQPWLLVNRDPVIATQDNTYVAYDDFGGGPAGQVAVSRGARPPDFTIDNTVGPVGGTTNPAFRLGNDPRTGTMYAVFERSSGTAQPKNVTYVLNRSTDGGATWTLNGSATGLNIDAVQSDQAPGVKFGTVNALLGGIDHVAVDPTTGDVYVVYGADTDGTGAEQNRLFIRRLTPNGTGGLTVGPRVQIGTSTDAALPSVAVTTDGTVGVLYHTFDGFDPNNFPMFSAHLVRSRDHGLTFDDVVLEQFLSPARDNGNERQRVLGDYQQLKALGSTFYGSFAGNRMPLNGGTGPSVIDPVYFSATGNRPPVCTSASASPNTLWPPNHKLRNVTIAGVTDPDNDPLTVTIVSVTQDEPVNGLGSGDTAPDATIPGTSATVLLRAERSGRGDGRVYRVSFTATDPQGASCTGIVTVGVPMSQRPGTVAVDSAPPSFNSLVT